MENKKVTMIAHIIGMIVGWIFDFVVVTSFVLLIQLCFKIPVDFSMAVGVWLVDMLIQYWIARGKNND